MIIAKFVLFSVASARGISLLGLGGSQQVGNSKAFDRRGGAFPVFGGGFPPSLNNQASNGANLFGNIGRGSRGPTIRDLANTPVGNNPASNTPVRNAPRDLSNTVLGFSQNSAPVFQPAIDINTLDDGDKNPPASRSLPSNSNKPKPVVQKQQPQKQSGFQARRKSTQVAQKSNQTPQKTNQEEQITNQVEQKSKQVVQKSNQKKQKTNQKVQKRQISNQTAQKSNQKAQKTNQKPH